MLHLFYCDLGEDYIWDIDTLELLSETSQFQRYNFIKELIKWYDFDSLIQWLIKNEIPYATNRINHIVLQL